MFKAAMFLENQIDIVVYKIQITHPNNFYQRSPCERQEETGGLQMAHSITHESPLS